ncbi:MAG: transposase [Clostridium sp.]|nr:transposase [Clostridium sp.]
MTDLRKSIDRLVNIVQNQLQRMEKMYCLN